MSVFLRYISADPANEAGRFTAERFFTVSNPNVSEVTRRRFLQTSVAGLAVAGLPAWFVREAHAHEQQRAANMPLPKGPNEMIRLGVIGPGGSKGGYRQGLGVARAAHGQPNCRVIAACDVDKTHLAEAVKAFGDGTQGYVDYRELIARPDIDAVVIGTPDHWHAVIAIAAMRAGKHVYCEKPLTHNIGEGKELTRVARETGRAFQVGSQQRSDGRFRLACEVVRNGRIGKIKRVEARLPGAPAGGPFPPQPVPADFDFDRWLGPAPRAEYVKERTHGNFRYWYEYAGGMMTDWGAHHLDITQWGLGMDRSGPVAVSSVGTLPENATKPNAYNVHTSFDVTYTYRPLGTTGNDDITVLATSKGENGVRFEGDKGWVFVSRGKIEASDPKILSEPLPDGAIRLYASNDHVGNFIEGVRTGKPCICDAETGHRSVSVCHIGNISLRLGGRRLEWDPRRQEFKNDAQANALLSRPMRREYAI